MNPSQLLTSLKMDLGIYGLRLPFDDPDKAIMDVINLKTIKSFSVFSPRLETINIDVGRDVEKIKEEYTESVFTIPNKYPDREILYVRRILPQSKLMGNGFISPVFDGSIETYLQLGMTQAQADLASLAAPPITFKFDPPNILHVYNLATYYGRLEVELAFEHAQNLSTIPQTSWESFYELALLDVKRFLYNSMKHYTEIQSAFGTIVLKIDDWQSAESDRKDLIERMKDVYHLDVDRIAII